MIKQRVKLIAILMAFILLFSTISFATDTLVSPAPDAEELEIEYDPEEYDSVSIEDLLALYGIDSSQLTEEELAEFAELFEGTDSEEPVYYDEEGNVIDVDKSDWIQSDVYEMSSSKYELSKIVDGNAFIIGKDVVIGNEVGGDVFVIADKLTIKADDTILGVSGGYIYSNLFAVANEVVIEGAAYDAYIVANKFTLSESGSIQRDLKLCANNVTIEGLIERNAYISANSININEDLGNIIGGDLNYSAPKKLDIPETSVAGEIKFTKVEAHTASVGEKILGYIVSALNNILLILAVVILALFVAPKFTSRVSNMSGVKAGMSILIGIASIFAMAVLTLLLLISLVFAKTAIVASFFFITLCMCGTAFVSIYLAGLLTKAAKWDNKALFILASFIVALAIWLISFIPVVGAIIYLALTAWGIGIFFVNVFSKKEVEPKEIQKEEKPKKENKKKDENKEDKKENKKEDKE